MYCLGSDGAVLSEVEVTVALEAAQGGGTEGFRGEGSARTRLDGRAPLGIRRTSERMEDAMSAAFEIEGTLDGLSMSGSRNDSRATNLA